MTDLDRIIIPEENRQYLEEPLVQPDHEITIYSKEKSVDKLTISAGGFEWDNRGREHLSTEKAECECGWTGNTIPEAENHLQEMAEQGQPTTEEIREALQDVAMHGFEFSGFEGHGSSLVWQHQELDIQFYATPLDRLTGEENTISIQMKGGMETPFNEMNGVNGEKYEFEDGLTFKQYLKMVREYVEDNLIRSRWESRDSEEHHSVWVNTHNEDFMIIVEELEENGMFEMYSTQGISKCPFDTGGNPEIFEKAIHYMQKNPLGKAGVSYQKVIEESTEYRYRGEQ